MNARAELAPRPGDALVVTDVQNDFVTGTLAVPGAAVIVAGFAAVVLAHGIRAVDVHPGDGATAEDAMRRAGARFARTAVVVRAVSVALPAARGAARSRCRPPRARRRTPRATSSGSPRTRC